MSNIVTETKTIGKREVNNLFKKIYKEILSLSTPEKIEEFVYNLIPDVMELGTERLSEDEVTIDFIIPRNYTGSHSKSEYQKVDDSFKKLLESGSVSCNIYKRREEFEICMYAWFRYEDEYGIEGSNDLCLNKEIIKIPLDARKVEINNLIEHIRQLSSGTLATLISNEKVGDASSMYLLIDEVRRNFEVYTKESIETTSKVPSCIDEAWNNFKRNVSVKDIAYKLGIETNKIEPYYEISSECERELQKIAEEMKYVLEHKDIEFVRLSDDHLKQLTYAHALNVLKRHCKACSKEGIDKVKNKTIPSILNGEYGIEFYRNYSKEGFEVLRNL